MYMGRTMTTNDTNFCDNGTHNGSGYMSNVTNDFTRSALICRMKKCVRNCLKK